ncbi:hypothetical protein C500_08352 [Natrialba magadii ATCC 43099]|uniref:DUF8147 domain-containing protein n=2 Tax=Natrialba magadii TaxID=13769 RepID=L9V2H6_NATMM|nr:hypothetical protein C500_08352 [Natrialba magadii ATCC 43099]
MGLVRALEFLSAVGDWQITAARRTIYTVVAETYEKRMTDTTSAPVPAPALAIASGFATFIVVSAAVEGLLTHMIGFSMLLALPVGALAGALAVAGVVAGLTGEVSQSQRRSAGSYAGLSIGFLIGVVVGTELLGYSLTWAALIGIGIGIVLGTWLSSQV